VTFRIDSMRRNVLTNGTLYRWAIRLKGLHGYGFYVTLVTNDAGEGLHLEDPNAVEVDWVREMDGIDLQATVVPCEALLLGAEDTVAVVLARVTEALMKLHWGPWVDQQGELIAADQEALRSIDFTKLNLLSVLE
jgi:hypothetical protein